MDSQREVIEYKDETRYSDEEIWKIYSGPTRQVIKEKDSNYLLYLEMLLKRIGLFSAKPNKHTITFCKGCFSFITLEGLQRSELGHPNSLLVTKTKLFKIEKITDIDSFVEWNKRTPLIIKRKGRETEI